MAEKRVFKLVLLQGDAYVRFVQAILEREAGGQK